jgi:NADH-quinone oxidoreductase subunit E
MSQELGSKFDAVCDILESNQYNRSNLIAILQQIQDVYSFLPEDILNYAATALGVSPCLVFGAATFYSHFTMTPKGKYVVTVCDGTACHVRKSHDIIGAFAEALDLEGEVHTSADGLFTLETVACLGACGLSPVVVINKDEVHGVMTPDKAKALIANLRKREEEANA